MATGRAASKRKKKAPSRAIVPPEAFIACVHDGQRETVRKLHELVRKTAPGLEPVVTAKILGYGKFHYRYPSGREGDAFLIGLAARKTETSMYVCAVKDGLYLPEAYRTKLPRANVGKSCIRIKKLSDVDLAVIRAIVRDAVKAGGAAAVS